MRPKRLQSNRNLIGERIVSVLSPQPFVQGHPRHALHLLRLKCQCWGSFGCVEYCRHRRVRAFLRRVEVEDGRYHRQIARRANHRRQYVIAARRSSVCYCFTLCRRLPRRRWQTACPTDCATAPTAPRWVRRQHLYGWGVDNCGNEAWHWALRKKDRRHLLCQWVIGAQPLCHLLRFAGMWMVVWKVSQIRPGCLLLRSQGIEPWTDRELTMFGNISRLALLRAKDAILAVRPLEIGTSRLLRHRLQ